MDRIKVEKQLTECIEFIKSQTEEFPILIRSGFNQDNFSFSSAMMTTSERSNFSLTKYLTLTDGECFCISYKDVESDYSPIETYFPIRNFKQWKYGYNLLSDIGADDINALILDFE